jgi:hypothetical protein
MEDIPGCNKKLKAICPAFISTIDAKLKYMIPGIYFTAINIDFELYILEENHR